MLAKECYEKLGEEYTSAVAVTLSNIGTVAWRCHDYEAAQEFFENRTQPELEEMQRFMERWRTRRR